MKDLHKLEDLVQQKCGSFNKIYRFPGGSLSSHADSGLIRHLVRKLEKEGYRIFDWDIDNNDGINTGFSAVEYSVASISRISKKSRIIFLSHNRPGDAASIESLPTFFRFCRQNGYRSALLDELKESAYCMKNKGAEE